jgi:hypothetical protein
MAQSGDLDRKTLLALTPAIYLAGGFRDAAGRPLPELRSTFATAAATQLEDAEASPQELGATVDALKVVLPLHQGAAADRIAGASAEALYTVASMLEKDNNPGIARFLTACAERARSDEDIDALLLHAEAVVRQYALITALANG